MKVTFKLALCALLLGSGAIITSCSKDDDEPAPAPVSDNSIYARLGGTTKITDPRNAGVMIEKGRLSYRSVVDSTIVLIVSDIRTGANGNLATHFAPVLVETGSTQTTSIARLSKNLTDFFSANTGGGTTNTYTGLDMVAAHNPGTGAGKNPRMGAKSTNANYDKFVGYVGAAAVKNGVAANTQLYADVVTVLQSLRGQIVQP
jgi:hypothetical protein